MLFFNYVVRKLVRRIGNNALTIAVIGLVLAGCILGAEFLIGLRAASEESLPENHVLVLGGEGALSEQLSSGLTADVVHQLEVLPEIREDNGVKAFSREQVVQVLLDADLTQTGYEDPQVIRGVDAIGYALHGAKIIAGRAPAPGAPELVVGAALALKRPKIEIGSTITLPAETWTVVGVFSTGGSVYEGELWADRARLAPAVKQDRINGVLIATPTAAAARALVASLKNDKRFEVTPRLEREARGSQAKVAQVTRIMFVLVLVLCVVGVFVTATNLHASVVSRMPEFVTLIALGVRRARVGRMMLLESMLLAYAGLALALVIALALGTRSSTMFKSETLFELRIGLVPVAFAAALATLIGVLGVLVPMVIARRIDLLRGLR